MSAAIDSSNPSVGGKSAAWLRLHSCVLAMQNGPWRFIQLRGEVLGEATIDGDDVDLLGRREDVDQLLTAALGWVQAGECHLRVSCRTASKVALSLISRDGLHRVDFDLWMELWQIDGRKRCLRYEHGLARVVNPAETMQRLPAPLEAVIYVNHLVVKRKKLDELKVRLRLSQYVLRCRESGQTELAAKLEQIAGTSEIRSETMQVLNAHLFSEMPIPVPSELTRRWTKLKSELRAAWFSPPRKLSVISFMGCDGVGKTTLAQQLAAEMDGVAGMFTGKHLYRKSLLFKLAVIFIRPLLFQNREKFDETLAPVVYLRACLGLRFKFWRRHRGVLLMDRSLLDFLFVGRKTDQPGFCRSAWLSNCFGRRVPTVHFILPFERVQERKQEMTRTSHQLYDLAMFQRFTQRCPTDYLAFNNADELAPSQAALQHILSGWLVEK